VAGGSYVVSYLAPAGHYAADERAFGSGVPTASLYAYSNRQGKNGVYRYGAGFPTRSHQATNYYVDVVFVPDGGGGSATTTTTPPTTPAPTTVPTTTPTGGSCPVGQVGTAPDCLPTPPSPLPAGRTWKINFHDEFDGNALNTTHWTPCFDWNYGACTDSFNTGKEHYDPGQVRVSNGTAKLVAEPLSPPLPSSACYNGSCTYKAGLISTARPNAGNGSAYLHPFTYGYIEARMKYPAVSGMFTAFWMLPTDPSYTYRNEIDIVEILGGNPDTIFMTYHYNDRTSRHSVNAGDNNNGACGVRDYSQDWARFGLDWQPTYVAWYIDGVKCGQFNGNTTTIENGPMQLILHMMVDNSWERDWGLVLANQNVAATLEVDYVRVYQQE
jgi:hypothetical protein